MTDLTETIRELRELLAKATPGAWYPHKQWLGKKPDGSPAYVVFISNAYGLFTEPPFATTDDIGRDKEILSCLAVHHVDEPDKPWPAEENAKLICLMKTHLPALLDAAERAERYEKWLDEWHTYIWADCLAMGKKPPQSYYDYQALAPQHP